MVSMPYIFSNEIGGPIWAIVATVYVIVIALAIWVLVDAFRPKRKARFAEILEPRFLYPSASVVYLATVFGVWLPFVPRDLSLVPVLFTPLQLAIGAAYLLRVDFPAPASTPDRSSTDSTAEPTEGDLAPAKTESVVTSDATLS